MDLIKLLVIALIIIAMQSLQTCQQRGKSNLSKQDAVSETVTIKRSKFGMAHIKADSLYELGYGNAYAQAQQQLAYWQHALSLPTDELLFEPQHPRQVDMAPLATSQEGA